MKILVTGGAGFIGSHLAKKLLNKGENNVIAIDNLNKYYDNQLKKDRVEFLNKFLNFKFYKIDICDKARLKQLFEEEQFEIVINLAAQAGVRYSLENPAEYVESNINGFLNILELCKDYSIKHLLYASSSSVYGGNIKSPFSTKDNVDHPVSMYAVTKKTNELMAHSYSHLYNLPTTGLRFFTVYGPWGRPDMAYYKFTKDIIAGKEISVYNNGDMERDFTYIDDIVESITRLISILPEKSDDIKGYYSPSESWAPYKVYNIGNSKPVKLLKFINILEENIGIKAKIAFKDMQPGDVKRTFADTTDLEQTINFKPETSLDCGLKEFVLWYKNYYL